MSVTAQAFMDELAKLAKPQVAELLKKYFKEDPKDQFIGVRPPQTQKLCKQYVQMPLGEVQKLFNSPVHEHRQGAAMLLAEQYKSGNSQQAVFDAYVKNLRGGNVNNWDIVDMSAEYIIAPHQEAGNRDLLVELAKSKDIWSRRAAIMATFYYIKKKDPKTTLHIAEILVGDNEDLVQKAVGWMLREVGKRCSQKLLTDFLDKHVKAMPRTMLRYAIEKLPAELKKQYMATPN